MCPLGAQGRDGAEAEHSADIHETLAVFPALVIVFMKVSVLRLCVYRVGNSPSQWVMLSIVIFKAQGAIGGKLN